MLGQRNIFLNTDSYKPSHYLQYPNGTTRVNSYIESRGGRWKRVLFFGLQMFLKEYLSTPFTKGDLQFAEEIWKMHGEPFNGRGAKYILDNYGGFLPLDIQAVREGTVLETENVLVQVSNNDDNAEWLTSFVETALLRAIWYPVTVATLSFMIKNIIMNALKLTADDPENEIAFKLHDFGSRGASSWETSALGGCSHLVNFMGSDNMPGVLAAREYYHEKMAGFSIPASEHSTITAWGEDYEIDAFENMIDQFGGPGKMFACVSDSYSIWDAVEFKWPLLKEKLIAKGGTLVVRPDSGNPVAVVSGVIERLMSKFGYIVNSKGYRVLPDYIRVIQGDGVDETSIRDILQELQYRKISASNVAFGMGGALLQRLDRDTLRFAMKGSEITVDGEIRDIYKNPVTDQTKASKRGRLALIKVNPKDEGREGDPYFMTVQERKLRGTRYEGKNQLELVYHNGQILREQSFSEIRKLANSAI